MSEGWEREAGNWVAWARTPGHDAYWSYRDAFFDDLLAPPGRRTLEVGCGEGRVARDLAARGHRVTALDASPTLVRLAREADPAGDYVVGVAEELPFPDAAFDVVVAYNSLIDVEDMPRAVAEIARVLERGGRLCACVTHPLADAGSWTDADEFVVDGSYLGQRRFSGTFERDGLTITFDGWTYPVADYARALEDAGLLLEAIREPVAPPGYRRDERWSRLPMFLHFRALKP